MASPLAGQERPYTVPYPLWCNDTALVRKNLTDQGYVLAEFGATIGNELAERFEGPEGKWLLALKIGDQTCVVFMGDGWQLAGDAT